MTGEIPILVPSIKRKGLIEAKIVLSDGSQAEAHIASVSEEGGGDPLFALRAGAAGHDRLCLGHGQTGSLYIVSQYSSGGSDYIGILRKKALGDLQVLRVEIEIIIDEKQNVVVASQSKDGISLPGQPQWGLYEGYVGKVVGRIAYVRWLRESHQDLVRLPFLLGQKGYCFAEDCGPTPGSNTNNQSCLAFHRSSLIRVAPRFAPALSRSTRKVTMAWIRNSRSLAPNALGTKCSD